MRDLDDDTTLDAADRALLRAALTPSDERVQRTRAALATKIAALGAGAAAGHGAQAASASASTAKSASSASSLGMSSTSGSVAAAAKGATSLLATKWIGASVLVVAVAGGAVLATQRAAPVAHAPHVAFVPHAPHAPRAQDPASPTEPEADPANFAEQASPSSTQERPAAIRSASKPRTRELPQPDALHDELALLQSARAALHQREPARALRWLDQHATLFPRGAMRQEALATRALALCAAGRQAEAERVARKLEKLAPRSPHWIALADSCVAAGGDPQVP